MISNRTANKIVIKQEGTEPRRLDAISDQFGVVLVCADRLESAYIALSPSDVKLLIGFLESAVTTWDKDEV